MARSLTPGSLLNEIFGSLIRIPEHQVLVWNPHRVTLGDVAAGRETVPPVDVTAFVESIDYAENIGFENADDPTMPRATFQLKRNPNGGVNIRRGLVEDGVIVQIRQGDRRVAKEDWIPVFTGTFRGRPGDDPGSRATATEGLSATAYGREERYLNLPVTTRSFPKDTDLGEILLSIAKEHMGLGQDEIRIGALGFTTRHVTNQVVEEPALSALWHCLYPAGKKPKFDALGRLVAADVRLDKPAVRIYSEGDPLVVSCVAAPNDVEVNNSVALRGLASEMTKVLQQVQLIAKLSVVTGFFDRRYNERVYFSDDRTQRAQDTYLIEAEPIWWSKGRWSQEDEFHGRLKIDTRYLANVRTIIFASYLALQLAIAIIDLYFQQGGVVSWLVNLVAFGTPAGIRFKLQILSQVALAALLWSMTLIGRGEYEVWGKPFEYCYQELVARHQLAGLDAEEVRELEIRNDFFSTMAGLDAAAAERLRREILKNQVHQITLLDDPGLEVDDVIEMAGGDRYYITSIQKTLKREAPPVMTVTAWKIADGTLHRTIDALEPVEATA